MKKLPLLLLTIYALLAVIWALSIPYGWWEICILLTVVTLCMSIWVLRRMPQMLLAPRAFFRYTDALAAAQRDAEKDAFHAVDDALSLAPNFALAHALRATLLLRDDRADDALEAYNRALDFAPHLRDVRALRLLALARAGKVAEVRAAIREPRWLNRAQLGTAALFAYEYDTAYIYLRRALRLRQRLPLPDDPILRNNLGVAALHTQRTDEAAQLFQTIIQTRPNAYYAHANYGYLLANAGQYAQALAAIEKGLALKPDYHQVIGYKGYALFLRGTHQAALACAEDALALKPDHIPHIALKSVALQALAQQEDALTCWRDLAAQIGDQQAIDALAQRYGWNKAFCDALHAVSQQASASG